MDRRGFLLTAATAATSALAGACNGPRGVEGTVRVGVLANLTHAPMITALASGRLQKALGGLKLEVRTFRAGPRVCEAFLGNAIDIGSTGPGPVVAMHARHSGGPIRIVSGIASGGVSFVVLPSIKSARDLAGKQVATVQVGSTQDVSLRKYLAKNGLVTKERGGDVVVHALASANIQEQMRKGVIAGAWLQEPWSTKIVDDLGAVRLLDERSLWPDDKFPTALLTARKGFQETRRAEVDAVAKAIAYEVEFVKREPAAARELVFAEIKRLTSKGLPRKLVDRAWGNVDFTTDPVRGAIAQLAHDAEELGHLPACDVGLLFA